MLELEKTALEGLFVLTPRRFCDARGWFSETWNYDCMAEVGVVFNWIQDNHSYSAQAGTLRGLHYQAPPRVQAKLVRCTRGAIRDVAVDARIGSPTFGQWVSIDISAEDGRQVLIPPGFLHGFITILPCTEVQYKVDQYYDPTCDGSVHWQSLNIDWQFSSSPILSPKDASAPNFESWQSPFFYGSRK